MEIYQGSKILVILHGWQDSKETWEPLKKEIEKKARPELVEGACPEFVEGGIRVIVPDLPGFKKETELERSWDLDNYVEWARKFIEEICPERAKRAEGTCGELAEPFFLMGYSFGGRVALKFVQKYPEKISGIILVASAGVTVRPKIKITVFWIISKIGNLIFSLPILNFFQPLSQRILYFLAGARDYKKIKTPFLKETFRKVIGEDLTALLPQIKTPALIIWGDKDVVTPLKDAYLMKEKIKNSQLEILKGFKHCSYCYYPKIVAPKIINFINQTL